MELLFRNWHKIYDRALGLCCPCDFPPVCKTHSTACKSLQTMFLLELEVFFPQGVHSVNHLLDELDLRVAKTVLVRHVVSAA